MLRYLGRPFRIITDQFELLFGEAHVRLAYLFVFRNQGLEAFGPHADEHLAAVLRVAHALDQPALLEPVENVRRRTSGKACPLEEPARSDGAARSTEDEVETLVSVALSPTLWAMA